MLHSDAAMEKFRSGYLYTTLQVKLQYIVRSCCTKKNRWYGQPLLAALWLSAAGSRSVMLVFVRDPGIYACRVNLPSGGATVIGWLENSHQMPTPMTTNQTELHTSRPITVARPDGRFRLS